MGYQNYSDMDDYIRERREFRHGRNGRVAYGVREGNMFSVYSYNTLILRVEDGVSEPIFFDNSFFSYTTSRLQGIIRRVLDIPMTIQRKVYSEGCYQVA